MSEKIYCGSGRVISTQYGDLTKVSFHKDDINKMVQYMKDNKSDWINLVVKEKKEVQEGKPTHYLEVDTWKPDTSKQDAIAAEKIRGDQEAQTESDDLPF
jgi:hypothetical protein